MYAHEPLGIFRCVKYVKPITNQNNR